MWPFRKKRIEENTETLRLMEERHHDEMMKRIEQNRRELEYLEAQARLYLLGKQRNQGERSE